jgi:hypothetical protein
MIGIACGGTILIGLHVTMKKALPFLLVVTLLGAAVIWAAQSSSRKSARISEVDTVLTIETKDIDRILASDKLSVCAALKTGDKDRYYLLLHRTGTLAEALQPLSGLATVLAMDQVSVSMPKE